MPQFAPRSGSRSKPCKNTRRQEVSYWHQYWRLYRRLTSVGIRSVPLSYGAVLTLVLMAKFRGKFAQCDHPTGFFILRKRTSLNVTALLHTLSHRRALKLLPSLYTVLGRGGSGSRHAVLSAASRRGRRWAGWQPTDTVGSCAVTLEPRPAGAVGCRWWCYPLSRRRPSA